MATRIHGTISCKLLHYDRFIPQIIVLLDFSEVPRSQAYQNQMINAMEWEKRMK